MSLLNWPVSNDPSAWSRSAARRSAGHVARRRSPCPRRRQSASSVAVGQPGVVDHESSSTWSPLVSSMTSNSEYDAGVRHGPQVLTANDSWTPRPTRHPRVLDNGSCPVPGRAARRRRYRRSAGPPTGRPRTAMQADQRRPSRSAAAGWCPASWNALTVDDVAVGLRALLDRAARQGEPSPCSAPDPGTVAVAAAVHHRRRPQGRPDRHPHRARRLDDGPAARVAATWARRRSMRQVQVQRVRGRRVLQRGRAARRASRVTVRSCPAGDGQAHLAPRSMYVTPGHRVRGHVRDRVGQRRDPTCWRPGPSWTA